MAFINAEQVKAIRNKLKENFPEYKFSVRKASSGIALDVTIRSGPVRFSDKDYAQINHYHLANYPNKEILEKIVAICNEGNYDNSDSMTDYFDVGWYFHLSVGDWDRPYIVKG